MLLIRYARARLLKRLLGEEAEFYARPRTSEEISAWLKWYDSLQPLILTQEERLAWDEDQSARRAWEQAHADERAEKLRRLWG